MKSRSALFGVLLVCCCPVFAAGTVGNWLDIVRNTAYWESQGVADNLATVRRWVLFSESYCSQPDRHILLDRRWRFLGFIDDGGSAQETMERINSTRQRLAEEERVDAWAPGTLDSTGYPFALACNQPFTDMDDALARISGTLADYRVWGTWDGMEVGAESSQVSLLELFLIVSDYRRQQERFSFPDSVIATFLGKIIIESGGQKLALSTDNAQGILQLTPAVLEDCEIPEAYHLHRIAQVDCALRLMEQNHRNLVGPFNERFGAIPAAKREALYDLLLTQAYQVGIGRTIQLLQDEELGRAAAYFAEHESRFSAEDMLVGMMYHNLGRRDIGLLSLYYVTDARLAQTELCAQLGNQEPALCPP